MVGGKALYHHGSVNDYFAGEQSISKNQAHNVKCRYTNRILLVSKSNHGTILTIECKSQLMMQKHQSTTVIPIIGIVRRAPLSIQINSPLMTATAHRRIG